MPDFLKQSYQLRFESYCLSKKFIPKEDYPELLEIDKYDKLSHHIFYIENSIVVGTLRMIPFSLSLGFPAERYFPFLYDIISEEGYPIESTVEVSRFCISKRCSNKFLATVQLFKELWETSKEDGITHWIACFEKTLYRLLKRQGFEFNLLSNESVDYFGEVYLYGITINDIEKEVRGNSPDLCKFFEDAS